MRAVKQQRVSPLDSEDYIIQLEGILDGYHFSVLFAPHAHAEPMDALLLLRRSKQIWEVSLRAEGVEVLVTMARAMVEYSGKYVIQYGPER